MAEMDVITAFSPGDDCRNLVIDSLKNAKNKVLICVFTISDNNIAKAILDCHERGVDVEIITDNDKMYDKGSDIFYLERKGIKVMTDHTRHHMHHKFMVADNELLITGSFNWTRSATRYNHENLIALRHQGAVSEYVNVFIKLWNKLSGQG